MSHSIPLRPQLPHIKTAVVKIGSRILTAGDEQKRHNRINALVEDIIAIRQTGVRLILVSSGAIAHGMCALGLGGRPKTIPLRQACASVGQFRLMQMWESFFARHATPIGQVLLTWDDLRDKTRYLNLRNTLFALLDCNAVPIINENDSVGINEIRFGDNDTLGAQIAMLVNADVYVILTDVDGLYDSNPAANPSARQIPLVSKLTSAIKSFATENKNEISVGGMITKLKAADMVTHGGTCALVGNGFDRRLCDVLSNPSAGTLFLPSETRLNARARWMAFTGRSRGTLTIDSGAQRALVEKGKSLLPAGVKSIHGAFKAGDMIDIAAEGGTIVARGLINYSSHDANAIIGCNTHDIEKRLGFKTFDEMVHRDNLVVM